VRAHIYFRFGLLAIIIPIALWCLFCFYMSWQTALWTKNGPKRLNEHARLLPGVFNKSEVRRVRAPDLGARTRCESCWIFAGLRCDPSRRNHETTQYLDH